MVRTVTKGKKGLFVSTGRRKTAIARIFLRTGTGKITINGKEPVYHLGNVSDYLNLIKKPFAAINAEGKYDIIATVRGGGISGQADAIRLGIARALVKVSETNKEKLKDQGLLTRDPRDKERKKYGRKRARKRFQFSKR